LSINVEYTENDPPFNKIPNLKEVRVESTSQFMSITGGFVASSASYIPLYGGNSNKEYEIELIDGTIFKLDDEKMRSLIELMNSGVEFKNAILVVNV